MKISSLYVKNVLGISEVRIECGRVTKISGRNGSRKTSILEALKAGIGGGDLNKLQRVNADGEAEVVLVLDDGAYRVQRAGKSTVVQQRVGESAAYEDVKRPQSFLDSLFDQELANPIRFLNAPANERADLLLEVLPLQLDSAALLAAIGDVSAGVESVRLLATRKGHPLQILTAVRDAIFNERTGVNRSEKEKRGTVASMEKTLPAKMPSDAPEVLAALEAERDELQATVAKAAADVEAAVLAIVRDAESVHAKGEAMVSGTFKVEKARRLQRLETDIATLRETADREIGVMREVAEAALKALDEGVTAAREEADRERATRSTALVEPREKLSRLQAEIATARAQLEEQTRLKHTAELRDKFQEEADSLLGRAGALSVGITALDAFKAKLLEALPIEDLTVDGKDIRIKNVPFDQLNFAQRARVAVQLASLRAKTKKLPILFVDGAECFDAKQLEVVLKEVEAAGCQAFLARVEDHDLEITTTGRAVVTA